MLFGRVCVMEERIERVFKRRLMFKREELNLSFRNGWEF